MRRRSVQALCVALAITACPAAARADSAPVISAQPELALVDIPDAPATFSVVAEGTPAPSVQWEEAPGRNGTWTAIPGATDATLNVTSSAANIGHAFRAVLTNSSGSVVSRPAKLVATTEWMTDLGSDIADIPLTELTIPGTHDMGTYGITNDSFMSHDSNAANCGLDIPICRSYGIAQTLGAHEELTRGIRYFDLRVCGHGTVIPPAALPALSADPFTCHGLEGGELSEILTETRLFVDQHPGEVVLLDINHLFAVDPDVVADQIEDEFGPRLIPPQYCSAAADADTCAGDLTLSRIAEQHLGDVIVNFDSDGGESDWEPGCVDPRFPVCPVPAQPRLDRAFYARHPRLWGRADGPPSTSHGGQCTQAAAFPSCFGNVDTNQDAQDRALQSLEDRTSRGDSGAGGHFQRFFVQFLQTTPDAGTIASDNGGGSLRGEAVGGSIGGVAFENGSNPLIGPAVLGCEDTAFTTGTCFGQRRPENVNILALNFFEHTDYDVAHYISQATADLCTASDHRECPLTPAQQGTVHCGFAFCWYTVPVHFDLAGDAIRFDEYAHTAPVVAVWSDVHPAASGWYDAASLGGQGRQLKVNVTARDFKWGTGIDALDCLDGASSLAIGFTGPTTSNQLALWGNLGDGVHHVDCRASDGADEGLHAAGNRGAGPGSTPIPAGFRVDTTAPVITCPSASLVLGQPIGKLDGTVTDATSGVAQTTGSQVSTAQAGTFTATLTATDVAGNSASKDCPFTVSYRTDYLYDTTKRSNSGSTVPIKVRLADYAGNDAGSRSIAVTARTVTKTATGTIALPASPGATNRGGVFERTATSYLYNLKTTGYSPGSYTLDFTAGDDPITHHAPFAIR